MVDRLFAEQRLAELYDRFCYDRPEFEFYMDRIMAAPHVLDVGCGTGEFLRRAREQGHAGRLCGVDPAAAMLDVARQRQDIEWVLGDMSAVRFDGEFDLAIMTGHAFQVLLTDEAVLTTLCGVHDALAPGGLFVFETRNPLVRGWEQWTALQFVDEGHTYRDEASVRHVDGEFVTFVQTFSSTAWQGDIDSWSTLRFLNAAGVRRPVAAAGLEVETQLGDWDTSPFADDSPEIVTIARRP